MRVGFVGLGNMGRPMALNAATAGLELIVHDIAEAALAPFRERGFAIAGALEEIAGADIVALMVRSDADVEACCETLFGRMTAGGLIVVHATVKPATVRALAERAHGFGLDLIDAPVSGGERGAAARSLVVAVGGEGSAVERAMPLLSASAARVIHVGAAGQGCAAKLVNNAVAFMNMVAASEGYRLARAAGLKAKDIQAVMSAGSARSHAVESWTRYPEIRASYIGGPQAWMDLIRKDLALALEFAAESGADMPMARLTQSLIERAFKESD